MNQDLKAKWIAALRSGQYQQARGQLRKHGAYCCLGVLCRIAGLKVRESQDVMFAPDDLLPRPVQREIADRNDGIDRVADHPWSFAEIADWVEANIPSHAAPVGE